MKLQDKVAVVTGAGSGTGKAIATLFAREGAKVIVTDIDQTGVNDTVSEIEGNGGVALGLAVDITKQEHVDKVVETALAQYKQLDILVNNAGIMDEFTPVVNVTDDLWDRVMEVNLTAPLRLIRACVPQMIRQRQGVIVNIASVSGLFGSRAGTAYTVSKHGVIGLTQNVGFQYAKLGIRCNAIAPGMMETNVGSNLARLNPFGYEMIKVGESLHRRDVGEPNEVANIALFLSSDDSSFINGTVIKADGGWTAY